MALSSSWIQLSPSLKKGITFLNKIDGKKFHLLLNRIVLEMKQNPNSCSLFSDEERDKLAGTFTLTRDEIDLLINCCYVIICQAVYNVTNPEKFKMTLVNELRLDEEKAVAFSNVWSSVAKSLILKMKQKSVFSTQLEDVSWMVNINIASSDNPQTFIPKTLLQLKLKEGEGTSKLDLHLEEKELYELYNTLENIQGALDSLS